MLITVAIIRASTLREQSFKLSVFYRTGAQLDAAAEPPGAAASEARGPYYERLNKGFIKHADELKFGTEPEQKVRITDQGKGAMLPSVQQGPLRVAEPHRSNVECQCSSVATITKKNTSRIKKWQHVKYPHLIEGTRSRSRSEAGA